MDKHKAILLHTSIRGEIRREIAIAKANRGNDWQLHSIVNSWGSTMDDRETLQAIRTLNQTGSMFATIVCTVH